MTEIYYNKKEVMVIRKIFLNKTINNALGELE